MKPNGLVLALASDTQKAWEDDMTVQYAGHEVLPLGMRLERRFEALQSARTARMGVRERAAELAVLLVQVHHVGDDPINKEPELPFTASPEDPTSDGADEEEREARMPKKGSPKR